MMLVARLIAGEQVLAVLGVEEFAERLDAADDEEKIVLAFEREDRIDQIVPRALLAELNFQAIGEESEQLRRSAAFDFRHLRLESASELHRDLPRG